jgi:hypothetical protein
MTTTLSGGTVTVALSDDMEWTDEHDWQAVVQSAGYSLAGASIIESARRATGRPITLAGSGAADDVFGLMPRTELKKLEALADVAGQTLTLLLRGDTYKVMFRHQEPPAISAKPLWFISNPTDTDPYVATIKLMVIS